MRTTKPCFIISAFLLGACQPTYSSNPNLPYGSYKGAEAAAEPHFEQCQKDRASRKIKTFFAANRCMTDVMDTYFSSYFLDKAAYSDYKTQRLMLASKVDKKQLTKDEANVIITSLFDKLIAIEHDAWIAMENRSIAQQQRENGAYIGALQSLGNSMQQRYQPQQPQPPINCVTVNNMVGSTTRCQ